MFFNNFNGRCYYHLWHMEWPLLSDATSMADVISKVAQMEKPLGVVGMLADGMANCQHYSNIT